MQYCIYPHVATHLKNIENTINNTSDFSFVLYLWSRKWTLQIQIREWKVWVYGQNRKN